MNRIRKRCFVCPSSEQKFWQSEKYQTDDIWSKKKKGGDVPENQAVEFIWVPWKEELIFYTFDFKIDKKIFI